MRIIAGQFRGHGLISPDGHETRPSTGRTRESLFSLVDARIYLEGAEVLDLFAGTGALGLEAISRGAALVTFVEQDPDVLDIARQNAEKLGVEDQCIFIPGDAVEYLRRYSGPALDLIMADPPYKLEAMRELPDLAVPHLTEDGVFTLERIVEKTAHAPALRYGIVERGFLREGYHADLVIVDPITTTAVREQPLLSRCGWSPFENVRFRSRIRSTIVNGVIVWQQDHLAGEPSATALTFQRA